LFEIVKIQGGKWGILLVNCWTKLTQLNRTATAIDVGVDIK
jgi:hypothetical protein